MSTATVAAADSGSKWIPFYRRRWFIVLCLFTISPLALLPLLTGKVYRKQSGDGLWVPIKGSSKVIYALLSLWLIAAGFYGALNQDNQSAGNVGARAVSQPEQVAGPPTPTNAGNDTVTANSNDTDLDPDILRVDAQQNQNGTTTITITSAADSPIAINRLVVNNRQEMIGCDFSDAMAARNEAYFAPMTTLLKAINPNAPPVNFPAGKVLRTGDQLSVDASRDCGAPVKADVYTDQGKGSYNFGEN